MLADKGIRAGATTSTTHRATLRDLGLRRIFSVGCASSDLLRAASRAQSRTHTYCDLIKLGNQIEQAEPNSKKADELNQQMDELSAKLGPEYIALMGELQDMDADSEDGKQIASALEALDKLCAK